MLKQAELQKNAVVPAENNTTLMLVKPVGLETTPEFQAWLEEKATEVLRYLKLSYNQELPLENLIFHPAHAGYPDPIGQLRTHARVWGYNYKIKGENGELENAINPETDQPMMYIVWQKLDPPPAPIEVAYPELESDEDIAPEDFDAEPATAT
jgi:hypothetical protein